MFVYKFWNILDVKWGKHNPSDPVYMNSMKKKKKKKNRRELIDILEVSKIVASFKLKLSIYFLKS